MFRQKIVLQYSLAFKQKIVSEIESGGMTLAEARRSYDIRGCATIQNWMKKLGKNHLLSKVVRIEMKDEKDQIKELIKEKKALESALAQEHLKNLVLESLVEVAGEHYKVDLKKTFGDKASKKQ
jgi:transposase